MTVGQPGRTLGDVRRATKLSALGKTSRPSCGAWSLPFALEKHDNDLWTIRSLLGRLAPANLFCSACLDEHLQRAVAPRGESGRMAAVVREPHLCQRL